MRKRPPTPRTADLHTIEMMLDYAIVAGAELRLPRFVLLLRAARLDLMRRVGAAADINPGAGAHATGSLVMRDERPDRRSSLLHDR